MSIASYYRNMRDAQVEQVLETTAKKKDLLEKCQQRKKQKGEATSPSAPREDDKIDSPASSLEETVKYKELYKKAKKEKETLEKQLETERKQEQADKRKEQEVIKQLQKAKADLFHDNQEMARMTINLGLAYQEMAELKERLSQIETAYSQKDEAHQEMSRVLRHSKESHKKQKVQLDKVNHKIFLSKIRNKKLNEQCSETVESSKKLQQKLKEKDVLLNQFKENDPSLLLMTLHQGLSLRSLSEYAGVEKLYNKYCLLMKHKQLKEVAKTGKHPNFIYGTVEVFIDKTVGFTDLDGIRYTVMNPSPFLISGDPVSAILVGKFQVEITEVFHFELKPEQRKSTLLHSKKKSPLKRKGTEQTPINAKLGQGVRVLVLTSTNGVNYRDLLNMYGFDATWHDASEKLAVPTNIMMDKFDIILLSWDSNPQFTLGFIPDKDDKKYVFIRTQNEDKVLRQAYFTAKKLGLIN